MNIKKLKHLLLSGVLGLTACNSSSVIQSVDTAQFAEIIQEPGVQLVDVRTAEEYQAGHIGQALNIDVKRSDFSAQTDSLLQKDQPVAVYCRSGVRSMKAASILEEKGFKTIYNLSGGYLDWQDKQ